MANSRSQIPDAFSRSRFELGSVCWLTLAAITAAGCDRQDNAPRPEAVKEARTQALVESLSTEPTGRAVIERPTSDVPQLPLASAPTDTTGGALATSSTAPPNGPAPERAEATLKVAPGQKLEGNAKFSSEATGVRLVVEIEGAAPGKHGIHIHEKGDCSDIPGKSMGDHFSPDKHPHALPGEGNTRHLGDLGNIEVGPDGKGRIETTLESANLKPGDPKTLLTRAIVIHASEDKGQVEQPSGGSGAPIACGVIEAD